MISCSTTNHSVEAINTKLCDDYFGDYNTLISRAAEEFGDKFAAIASPTLSKQETVTFLYRSIKKGVSSKRRPGFPWRRLMEFVPRLILMFVRVSYASLRFRVRNIPEGSVYFRTGLVPRSVSGEWLVDDYFRQLPADLASTQKVVVGFTSVDIALLNQFARVRKDDTHILSDGLLSLFDIVLLFIDYILNALIQIKQKYCLDGVEVTEYINKSLLLDYLGLRSFGAYVEKYKCRKLISHKIKAFIYVFENQSWEKACCATLRESDIKLIGYQSSGFSPVFLNFFPTEQDSYRHPMPDVLLTVGDYFRRYLLEHGRYRIPVETFAALRFSYANDGSKYTVSPPNPDIIGRILYAFSVHIEQYPSIVRDLIEVFRNTEISVDLKLHPLYRLNDVKGIHMLPDNFRVVTDVNMDSLRDTYDCVLFNDNSFGIEALLKGVKSYQYNHTGDFSDDRFMYFTLWNVNYDFDDLSVLRDLILSECYEKSFDRDAVAAYMNAMYKPYTNNAEIIERLLGH